MKFNLLSSVSSLAIGGLVTAAMPGAAMAGVTITVPYSCNTLTDTCTETVALGSVQTDFTAISGTLSDFNNSGGKVLTSVVLTEGGVITSTGTLQNTSTSSGGSYSFAGGLALGIYGGSGAPSAFPTKSLKSHTFSGAAVYNYGLSATATLATISGSLGKGQSVSYAATGAFAPAADTLTTNLSSFYGTGTFNFLTDGMAADALNTTGGNFNAKVTTSGDPTVSITYHYSIPAPEPASLSIVGAGLVGLGVLRRRKKA
jgi:hypothetical protein